MQPRAVDDPLPNTRPEKTKKTMHLRPLLPLRRRLLPTHHPLPYHYHHHRPLPPHSHPISDHSLFPSPPSPIQTMHLRCPPLALPRPDEVGRLVELVELVESDPPDAEARLGRLGLDLSPELVAKVVESLNGRRIPALRFFTWARRRTTVEAAAYNLVVNNLGLTGDFDSMLELLVELSAVRHCVTEKALAFLSVYGSDMVGVRGCVERVVEVLCRARGSCWSSGVYSLIKVLCDLSHFDCAVLVMEKTARTTSYYKIFVAAKCKGGCFECAWKLFDEMREYGCEPTVKPYNYLLGSLCKSGRLEEGCRLLETMERLGYLPDAITFEVLAVHACRVGRLEFALEFLGRMVEEGVQPRPSTHAVFIKTYFWSGRQVCAYDYVVGMSERDRCCSCMNYSLLARLFQESGGVEEAYKVLVEMMGKGLLPNFSVYVKVLKDVHKKMGGKLTSELKKKYVNLCSSFEGGDFYS